MSEIPHLQAAVSRLKDKPFELVSLSLDDTASEVKTFVKSVTFPGTHVWSDDSKDSSPSKLYNIKSLPTWYLIDKDGKISARDPQGEKFIPAIEAILGPLPKVTTKAQHDHEG